MDGVIYHGNTVLPGVKEFIHWLQTNHKKYLFLTNNSGMTPKELREKLRRMDLDVPEENFYKQFRRVRRLHQSVVNSALLVFDVLLHNFSSVNSY